MGSDTVSEPDYLEVRAIWERGVYERVLDRARPSDLDRLEDISAAMTSTEDPAEAVARHQEFHEVLLHLTGNQFLVTIGTILHRFFWEFGYRQALVRKPPPARLLECHRSIVQLLRTGDPADIQQMIDLHLSPHLTSDDDGSLR
jgi:DNA-binding FadR family transcriptional regulator